jgi:hypothetical protein
MQGRNKLKAISKLEGLGLFLFGDNHRQQFPKAA